MAFARSPAKSVSEIREEELRAAGPIPSGFTLDTFLVLVRNQLYKKMQDKQCSESNVTSPGNRVDLRDLRKTLSKALKTSDFDGPRWVRSQVCSQFQARVAIATLASRMIRLRTPRIVRRKRPNGSLSCRKASSIAHRSR